MDTTTLATIFKNQYHAALGTLRQPIDLCPGDLWIADGHANPFWRIAYHTLFFTHLYLQIDEASFTPWAQHRDGYQGFKPLPENAEHYSKDDILAYWQVCDQRVDAAVDAMDLDADACGFHWYKMGKAEHQIVNIRHIQHHAAQLADRLRVATGDRADWFASGPEGSRRNADRKV